MLQRRGTPVNPLAVVPEQHQVLGGGRGERMNQREFRHPEVLDLIDEYGLKWILDGAFLYRPSCDPTDPVPVEKT